jgi:hypothetical protein
MKSNFAQKKNFELKLNKIPFEFCLFFFSLSTGIDNKVENFKVDMSVGH